MKERKGKGKEEGEKEEQREEKRGGNLGEAIWGRQPRGGNLGEVNSKEKPRRSFMCSTLTPNALLVHLCASLSHFERSRLQNTVNY